MQMKGHLQTRIFRVAASVKFPTACMKVLFFVFSVCFSYSVIIIMIVSLTNNDFLTTLFATSMKT